MTPRFSTKDFLHLISDHLPDMLWAKDITGHYLFANKALCQNLLMADSEEVIGKTNVYFAMREREKHIENPLWHTFCELCHNSDEIVLEKMLPMHFEEYGNIRGELMYLEVHKAPLFDDNGTLIGTIGCGRDITVQKKLEIELSQSNATFNTLLDAAIEGFFVFDENHTCIHANHMSEQFFGYSLSELVGKKILDFVALESHPLVRQKIEESDATPYKVKMIKKNGELFDALLRGKDMDLFGKTVRISAIMDISEQVKADETIYELAFTDQLTGLPNRQKMKLDMSNHHPSACIVFNIDKFREINDFFGVTIGDSILIQMADWFKSISLATYRIGGDEFALLLDETMEWSFLEQKVVQWLECLEETHFTIGDESIHIRMNIGVAIGSDKLLTQADIALHSAKEKKLPYALYEERENIEDTYRNNITMTATIRKALNDGRIICHYQPIADIITGKIVKFETLVRLIDEEGSLIPPLCFLPIAKKTKLYPRITRRVIHQACQLFANRNEEFSINLSVDDIEDAHTVQEIINTLLKTGTASRVVFEILESEGIENYDSVARFITQVKALGAKIAIDDFGTGYSNFEHVLRLNVDYIKIDGSLVKGIVDNDRHRIIIKTIVEFAEKIGAKTIAEFVSDEAILVSVKELGVDYSQGYFTGKPEPLI